jgi:ankyrin repeat protein
MSIALLDLGAKVNVQDAKGQTALMIAASFGNGDTMDALLEKGADLALTTKDGRTAYQIAQERRPDYDIDRLKPGAAPTKKASSPPWPSCRFCDAGRRDLDRD